MSNDRSSTVIFLINSIFMLYAKKVVEKAVLHVALINREKKVTYKHKAYSFLLLMDYL